MKIALIQPPWNYAKVPNDAWDEEALEGHLTRDKTGADLVVFPEGYPWSGGDDWETEEYWPLEFAQAKMAAVSRRTGRTFIAGGTVRENGLRRNVVMLAAPDRRDVQVYRKRLLWRNEADHIAPGEIDRDGVFFFGEHAVIPLICADVLGEQPRQGQTLMGEARRETVACRARQCAATYRDAPIVVCAYAAGPLSRVWSTRLKELVTPSKQDQARPRHALFCNFAGVHVAGGDRFGGGGSRLVSSDNLSPTGSDKPGTFFCDLGSRPPRHKFEEYPLEER